MPGPVPRTPDSDRTADPEVRIHTTDAARNVIASAGAVPSRSSVESEIDVALKAGKKDLHALILGGVEGDLIVRVLRHTRSHQGQACEILGIDPRTLRAKLRDLNLAVDKIVIERLQR